MAIKFSSLHQNRRSKIIDHPSLTGIDYLEVSPDDQHKLLLHFIAKNKGSSIPSELLERSTSASKIKIEGGVQSKKIRVNQVIADESTAENVLAIKVENYDEPSDGVGDFGTYTLSLANMANADPMLSSVDFSFKVNCPRAFDCKTDALNTAEGTYGPRIDYQSKDYASFRRLMLDRLAITMPGWKERNPSDLAITIIELLAYAADHLSYYQDAVATEAYLGTARRRASVRRHARILDYPMHDGCNSRVWIAIDLDAGSSFEGIKLFGPGRLDSDDVPGQLFRKETSLWPLGQLPGDAFLTSVEGLPADRSLNSAQFELAIAEGAVVFEIMHDITLRSARSRMNFYDWGEDDFCLPRGATSATLSNSERRIKDGDLAPGDVLIFEEVLGPSTGDPNDADRSHRHAVRLTGVEFGRDPLLEEDIIEIHWDGEDALPFDLCICNSSLNLLGNSSGISLARGNVVLADQGFTVREILDRPPLQGRYYPRLKYGPLTMQGYSRDRLGRQVPGQDGRPALFDPRASAACAMCWNMKDVQAAAKLADLGRGQLWLAQRDLLRNDRFALDFVVESEEDGSSYLRFGDNICGMRPTGELTAIYRIGNGGSGNIGAAAISHVFLYPLQAEDDRRLQGIRVSNPLPARGGQDTESIDQVRLYAPQAFRIQDRAVNESDYAEMAQRHPDVQKAIATLRWTGSWHTMFITVDRKGGLPIDQEFKEQLSVFLERFCLAGMDLEIVEPQFVPLDIILTIYVNQDCIQSDVLKTLMESFSNKSLADGRLGFFHPDNFTFNQDLYLSQVISLACQVPGVNWVDASDNGTNLFQRMGQPSSGEIRSGVIEMQSNEIVRVDNDPSSPERGMIRFFMVGGK
jgi:hypothetical protein